MFLLFYSFTGSHPRLLQTTKDTSRKMGEGQSEMQANNLKIPYISKYV